MRSVVNESEKKSKINIVKPFVFVAKVLGSIAVAISTYQFLAPLAAAERGYTGAIGGEGILVILALVGAYKLFGFVFENIE